MASNKPPAKVLCKYFMSNCCSKGNLCPFSHNWKDKPVMYCKYYLKGSCVKGKNCRYDHVTSAENHRKSWQTTYPLKREGPGSTHPSRSLKVPSVPEPVNLPSLSSRSPDTAHTHHNAVPPASHKMVTLRDKPSRNPKKWAQAVEFIPGKLMHGPSDALAEDVISKATLDSGISQVMSSYSDVLSGSVDDFLDVISKEEAANLLCPFAEMGHCPFETCEYLHGDLCDMCNRQCLNPFDTEQQKAHKQECLEMHEKEMEKAFQVQESEGKLCAICMEQIVTKTSKTERRFGILVNCEHCFCLSCIRKWRGSTHTANKTIRACPLCREVSYYVIPSEVWIDDQKQKEKLMEKYRDNLGKKHCKHFSMGEGTCPFGMSCFYKHEFPDGRKAVDVPRFYESAEGERKAVKTNTLWDYFNDREEETLDSLPAVHSTEEASRAVHSTEEASRDDEQPLTREQEELRLRYEPDAEDLEFL